MSDESRQASEGTKQKSDSPARTIPKAKPKEEEERQ
jgi:hypothetical protein